MLPRNAWRKRTLRNYKKSTNFLFGTLIGTQLEFICWLGYSCFHCSNLPKRKNQLLEIVSAFGGTCPSPQLSELHENHYKTFSEMMRTQKADTKLYNPTQFGLCSKGCTYIFFSAADQKRHKKLMHKVDLIYELFLCSFILFSLFIAKIFL